ncbi:MAG: hypothetical protein ACI915_002825 [Gammaproteobacteria bacterium]|jgi:hypothetical protein
MSLMRYASSEVRVPAVFYEGLDIVKKLFVEESATFDGQFTQID